MTKHIHAELMIEYAKDWAETPYPWERWEFCDGGTWERLTTHPRWNSQTKFRRKAKIININGFEVPEPLRSVDGLECVYIVYAHTCDLYAKITVASWIGDYADDLKSMVEKGLAHSTPENAHAHASALLSFTHGGQQ